MYILKILAQSKFISAECHAHLNAHKPPEKKCNDVRDSKLQKYLCVYK